MNETIELREGCLERPDRLDLGVIVATMLWPHDSEMRREANITFAVEQHSAAPLEIAKYAVPLRRLPFDEAWANGWRAGIYLHKAIEHVSVGKHKTMYAIAMDVCNAKPFPAIAVKTFQNTIWSWYRPVSHFWAAALRLAELPQLFPCPVEKLKQFFDLADGYRLSGETSRSKQSPSTILKSGDCIGLPAHLKIDPVKPVFRT
jgi:hypothetical protein